MKNLFHIFSQLRAAYANRTGPEGLELLARVYWRLILMAAIVAFLVCVGTGVMRLLGILGTFGAPPVQQTALPTMLDAQKLEAALSDFDARARWFEVLLSSTSTFPDPAR